MVHPKAARKDGELSEFGRRLVPLRTSRGYRSKNAFAQALKVAYTTVDAWERRGALPDGPNARKIAELLKLNEAEQAQLFGWAGSDSERKAPEEANTGLRPRAALAANENHSVRGSPFDVLLGKAFVGGKHHPADWQAVLDELGPAAGGIVELDDSLQIARRWLDAAADLRDRGVPATAAAIAVGAERLRATAAPASAPAPGTRVVTDDVGDAIQAARGEEARRRKTKG